MAILEEDQCRSTNNFDICVYVIFCGFFDLIGEPLPGWNIIANYAYTDALISQDNNFDAGTRLQNVPRHSANLWTSYEIQSGALEGLGLGAGISFVGDRNGSTRRPFVVPAYTRTDAAIFYRRDGFNAQLNFENLFDIRYFEGGKRSKQS